MIKIKLFEEFKEELTDENIYHLLADYIEEDNYETYIQKWYHNDVFDIAICGLSKEDSEDIIERLIECGFFVIDKTFGESKFGEDHDFTKISITDKIKEVKNVLSGSPGCFELKNKDIKVNGFGWPIENNVE